MILVVQTVRVHEMCIFAAEFLGAVVHHLENLVHRPADMTRERVRSFVARGQHQTIQQVNDGNLLTDLESGFGGIGLYAVEILRGDLDERVQIVHVFKGQQRGHDFGGRCRKAFFVCIFFIEHEPAFGVCKYKPLLPAVQGPRAPQRPEAGSKSAGKQ